VEGRVRKRVIHDMKLKEAVETDTRTLFCELANMLNTLKSVHLNILGKIKLDKWVSRDLNKSQKIKRF